MSFKKYVAENPEKVERFVSRIETVGLLGTMIAVVMLTRQMNGAGKLLIAGLSTLAFVYIFLTATVAEIFRLRESRSFALALQASYAALAVMMIGILFILMGWPRSEYLMYAGCAGTGVMFLFFTYKMYFGTLDDEAHRVIINNLVVRMLPALLVAGFLISVYLKT